MTQTTKRPTISTDTQLFNFPSRLAIPEDNSRRDNHQP
jgi:hypothetical protein